MENKLSYGVMLSLKEISLRRVTVILWSKTDALAYFLEFGLEDKVEANRRKLELPPLLKEEMKYLVKPIGSEIRHWKLFHEKNIKNISTSRRNFDIHILKQLCWTIFGSVDYRKTARNLIRTEILDTLERYKLACLYCLEDYIPVFWEKLPEWRKAYFYDEGPYDSSTQHRPLEFCWPYILKGEENKQFVNTTTFYQNVFEYSACKGNKAAAEFFFRKLTIDERESSLFRTTQAAVIHRFEDYDYADFPKENLSETICYLLSLLSPEQRKKLCKEYVRQVFLCLIDWHWQHIFWDIAEHFWPYLTAVDYVSLLKSIFYNLGSSYYTTKLFQEFFLRGSSHFRKCFVDEECQQGLFLKVSYTLERSEIIKFIFRNIDSVDRKRLIYSKFYFKLLISGTRLLETCLQLAAFSKEEKEKLKEVYFGFLTECVTLEAISKENIWKHFLQFLDENQPNLL